MAAIVPFLPMIQAAGAVFSVVTAINKTNADAKAQEEKSYEAGIKGRQDAVAYKKEGVEKLKELRRTLASNNARATAGGLDPFASGETIDLLNLNNMKDGADDWQTAKSNAEMAILMGNRQSSIYSDAASSTRAYGYGSALVNLGTDTANFVNDNYKVES
tara:strand:- start:275 stop:754 length:480 start_codon:yes stop_codon:yes gene_type:complete